MVFAAVLMVAFNEFRKDEEVAADIVKAERKVTEGKGDNTPNWWRE